MDRADRKLAPVLIGLAIIGVILPLSQAPWWSYPLYSSASAAIIAVSAANTYRFRLNPMTFEQRQFRDMFAGQPIAERAWSIPAGECQMLTELIFDPAEGHLTLSLLNAAGPGDMPEVLEILRMRSNRLAKVRSLLK